MSQTTKSKTEQKSTERGQGQKAKDLKNEKLDEMTKAVDAEIDKTLEEAAMDQLVDDIDAVLEVNAEQFVKNYVQRGGE